MQLLIMIVLLHPYDKHLNMALWWNDD